MNCAVFQLISSRSAPAARRSVSEVSAAISSRCFQRIDGGFDADDGLDVRRRGCFGIRERPFQDAVDDQVGIGGEWAK